MKLEQVNKEFRTKRKYTDFNPRHGQLLALFPFEMLVYSYPIRIKLLPSCKLYLGDTFSNFNVGVGAQSHL